MRLLKDIRAAISDSDELIPLIALVLLCAQLVATYVSMWRAKRLAARRCAEGGRDSAGGAMPKHLEPNEIVEAIDRERV